MAGVSGVSINPGKFDRKVRYFEKVVLTTESGAKDETKRFVSEFFASVKPISAQEVFLAGALRNEATHTVKCRWRREIKPNNYIKFTRAGKEITLRIVTILDDGNCSRQLVMLCKEGDQGG